MTFNAAIGLTNYENQVSCVDRTLLGSFGTKSPYCYTQAITECNASRSCQAGSSTVRIFTMREKTLFKSCNFLTDPNVSTTYGWLVCGAQIYNKQPATYCTSSISNPYICVTCEVVGIWTLSVTNYTTSRVCYATANRSTLCAPFFAFSTTGFYCNIDDSRYLFNTDYTASYDNYSTIRSQSGPGALGFAGFSNIGNNVFELTLNPQAYDFSYLLCHRCACIKYGLNSVSSNDNFSFSKGGCSDKIHLFPDRLATNYSYNYKPGSNWLAAYSSPITSYCVDPRRVSFNINSNDVQLSCCGYAGTIRVTDTNKIIPFIRETTTSTSFDLSNDVNIITTYETHTFNSWYCQLTVLPYVTCTYDNFVCEFSIDLSNISCTVTCAFFYLDGRVIGAVPNQVTYPIATGTGYNKTCTTYNSSLRLVPTKDVTVKYKATNNACCCIRIPFGCYCTVLAKPLQTNFYNYDLIYTAGCSIETTVKIPDKNATSASVFAYVPSTTRGQVRWTSSTTTTYDASKGVFMMSTMPNAEVTTLCSGTTSYTRNDPAYTGHKMNSSIVELVSPIYMPFENTDSNNWTFTTSRYDYTNYPLDNYSFNNTIGFKKVVKNDCNLLQSAVAGPGCKVVNCGSYYDFFVSSYYGYQSILVAGCSARSGKMFNVSTAVNNHRYNCLMISEIGYTICNAMVVPFYHPDGWVVRKNPSNYTICY